MRDCCKPSPNGAAEVSMRVRVEGSMNVGWDRSELTFGRVVLVSRTTCPPDKDKQTRFSWRHLDVGN